MLSGTASTVTCVSITASPKTSTGGSKSKQLRHQANTSPLMLSSKQMSRLGPSFLDWLPLPPCLGVAIPSVLFLPPLAHGGVNACGRWLAMPQRVALRYITPHPFFILLPGGQKGGLKSNWQLAGREWARAASRVALADNPK